MLASLFLWIEWYSILEWKRKQNFGESEEDICLDIPQTKCKVDQWKSICQGLPFTVKNSFLSNCYLRVSIVFLRKQAKALKSFAFLLRIKTEPCSFLVQSWRAQHKTNDKTRQQLLLPISGRNLNRKSY